MLCPQCGFNRQERRVKPCSISECRHEAALAAPIDPVIGSHCEIHLEQALAEIDRLIVENDLSAAMMDVVEAAEKVKMVHLSGWDCLGKGAFFQYRDTGALSRALERLSRIKPLECPKHPGATPPCAEDACECYGRAMDLAGAYQSIIDGGM